MTQYRFRTNWRGNLILQCSYPHEEMSHWVCWRDAGTEDLAQFYRQMFKEQS
jgi:hypothetical protein